MWLDQVASELREGLDSVRAELTAGEFQIARRAEPALAGFTLAELIEFSDQHASSPRSKHAAVSAA